MSGNKSIINDVLIGTNKLAEAVKLPMEFRKFEEKPPQRRKRLFSYEAQDQAFNDLKELYRVQCFTLVLDKAVQSLKSRFKQLQGQ